MSPAARPDYFVIRKPRVGRGVGVFALDPVITD